MTDLPERFFVGEDGTWNGDPIEPCMTEAMLMSEHRRVLKFMLFKHDSIFRTLAVVQEALEFYKGSEETINDSQPFIAINAEDFASILKTLDKAMESDTI